MQKEVIGKFVLVYLDDIIIVNSIQSILRFLYLGLIRGVNRQ